MSQGHLLTPGPTPLPPQVREALGRQIIHHRTAEYRAIFKRVISGMQQVMRTSQSVVALTSSGTGAMEAAVVNLLSPGDKAIVLLGGKFAERWQKLCQVYGMKVVLVNVAYGDAVDPAAVDKALRENPDAKVVFGTLCETSTGVVHDIEAVAAITRKSQAVLVIDAISGLAADLCETDAWGVDVVVTGSQKGLMLPPGLAFMSVSQRAWTLVDQSKTPKFYFDLKLSRKSLEQDDTPFTSAVSLIIAQEEAVKLLLDLGMPEVFRRSAIMAQAARASMQALGLTLFAKRPSNGVTSVNAPSGMDAKKLTKIMWDKHKVMVAGGQGEMEGKIFRIAHMGYILPEDLIAGIAAVESALAELGHSFTHGAGLKAAKPMLDQLSAEAVRR